MGKKRKADASRLDEADRNLYANFRSAANALSQLYSQTVTHQRLSFQSGERHALEKLYQWIVNQREQGSQVATDDIVAYIKDKVEYDTDDIVQGFPSPLGNNISPSVSQPSISDAPVPCNQPNVGFAQQSKNPVFLNILADAAHQSFPDPPHTFDDCTDMQTDDPSQKSVYRNFKHE